MAVDGLGLLKDESPLLTPGNLHIISSSSNTGCITAMEAFMNCHWQIDARAVRGELLYPAAVPCCCTLLLYPAAVPCCCTLLHMLRMVGGDAASVQIMLFKQHACSLHRCSTRPYSWPAVPPPAQLQMGVCYRLLLPSVAVPTCQLLEVLDTVMYAVKVSHSYIIGSAMTAKCVELPGANQACLQSGQGPPSTSGNDKQDEEQRAAIGLFTTDTSVVTTHVISALPCEAASR
jgi:hypothetical protein